MPRTRMGEGRYLYQLRRMCQHSHSIPGAENVLALGDGYFSVSGILPLPWLSVRRASRSLSPQSTTRPARKALARSSVAKHRAFRLGRGLRNSDWPAEPRRSSRGVEVRNCKGNLTRPEPKAGRKLYAQVDPDSSARGRALRKRRG